MVEKKGFEREVGVKTNFTLLKVNDAEESFLCDFELFFHFNDLGGIENSLQNARGFEEMLHPPDWTPHFFMYNQVSNDILEGPTYTIGPDNRIFGYLNWRIEVSHIFDVHCFPFDRQIFRLILGCSNANIVGFDDSKGVPPSFDEDNHMSSTVTFDHDTWRIEKLSGHITKPLFHMIYCTRNSTFYLFNIMVVNFIIVVLSATVYCIPIDQYASRLGVIMTALLTAVAFKFVTINWIPLVSYLTYLDWYFLATFSMMGMIVTENVLCVLLFQNDKIDEAENIDGIFTLVFVISWFVLHVLIFIGAELKIFSPSWDQVANTTSCRVTHEVEKFELRSS